MFCQICNKVAHEGACGTASSRRTFKIDGVDRTIATKDNPELEKKFEGVLRLRFLADATNAVLAPDGMSVEFRSRLQDEKGERLGIIVRSSNSASASGSTLGNQGTPPTWTYTPVGKAPIAASGTFDFVCFKGDHRVYVGKGHCALARGDRIAYGGEVTFLNGEVVRWTNRSGHFRPHPGFAHQAPFDIGKFFPDHLESDIEAEIKKPAKEEANKMAKERELETAKRICLDFAKLKLGRDEVKLDDIYDDSISRAERNQMVGDVARALGLAKTPTQQKLIAWGILGRR